VSGWLRQAGQGRLPDGSLLRWSVAEGHRGRRWRSTTLGADGAIALDLLLELDVAGRFARLELATAGGMLTLHPTASGSMVEGNIVTADRVRPLRLPWGDGHRLWVEGSPIPSIATGIAVTRAAASTLATGAESAGIADFIEIGRRLDVRAAPARHAEAADARGIPVLVDATEWALEAHEDA
jgi:hypothetical protein